MNALALFLKYFPFVLQGVVAVEQAIGNQPGKTKKQVFIGAITSAAQVAEAIPHIQAISNLVDATVGALNAAGVFGKSAAPGAPTT